MPGTQRTQRTYPRYVTREEFEKMFPPRVALTNPRDYVLFLCMFSLGLRNTEARTLKLGQFKGNEGVTCTTCTMCTWR